MVQSDDHARETFSRYDLVLLVIPLAFLAALVVSGLSAVGVCDALAAASLLGGVAVVDALFLHPPTAAS